MASNDCLFCKIVNGEMGTTFLHETEELVVFHDINPMAPVHLLIVPRRHIRSINDLAEGDGAIVSQLVFTARDMARRMEVDKSGYRLFFNVEQGGGQEVFHLHLHLIGGWQ